MMTTTTTTIAVIRLGREGLFPGERFPEPREGFRRGSTGRWGWQNLENKRRTAVALRTAFPLPICRSLGAIIGVLLFSLPAIASSGLTFLSPVFEQLSLDPLQSLQTPSLETPAPDLDQTLVEYFLSEAYQLSGSIHLGRTMMARADARCLEMEKRSFEMLKESDRSRAGYLCALVRADLLSNHPGFREWSIAARLEKNLSVGQLNSIPEAERLYAEGRLYASLPPARGRSFRKSLLAWNILKRLHPEVHSSDYWMGRVYLIQGNRARAREAFLSFREIGKADLRTESVASDRVAVDAPDWVDGVSFGFRPSLFASPADGFGLGLVYFDDRLWDTKRRFVSEASATTRGNFGAAAGFSDSQSLSDFTLEMDAGVKRGVEDFFGLGIRSAADSDSRLIVERFRAAVSATTRFYESYFFTLGWRLGQMQLDHFEGPAFSPAGLPQLSGITHSGAFAELGFDSRDSRKHPLVGVKLSVGGYFPAQNFGSPVSFEEWTGIAEGYVSPTVNHHFSLRASATLLTGAAPFAVFPKLSGSVGLPGVRRGRFTDRNAVATSLEYRYKLFEPVRISGFLNLGTVAPGTDSLWTGVWRWGGGGAVEFLFSSYRGQLIRFEVGNFGSETLFQAEARQSF